MLERARRPIAAFCVALLAFGVSCRSVQRQEPESLRPDATGTVPLRIRALTLRNGSEVRFDDGARATVRNDTLYSQVRRQPYGVAIADVQRVWIDSINETRTNWAMIGLATFAAVSALGVALLQAY